MATDLDVRTALRRAADEVAATAMSGPVIRARAGRRRRPPLWTVVAASTAVLVVAAVLVLPNAPGADRGRWAAFTADYARGRPSEGGYLNWPVRGDLAGEERFVVAARHAWDNSTLVGEPTEHQAVRPLLVTRTAHGPLVVLTGVDTHGQQRIAMVRGVATERSFSGAMMVEYDRGAPPPSDTVALVLWTHRGRAATAHPLAVIGPRFVARVDVQHLSLEESRVPLDLGAGARSYGADAGPIRRVAGFDSQGRQVFDLAVDGTPRGHRQPGVLVVQTFPHRPWPADATVLGPASDAGRAAVTDVVRLRTGAVDVGTEPSALWSAALPDGTEVYAEVVPLPFGGARVLVVARVGEFVDVYVDRGLDTSTAQDPGFAAMVDGLAGRWLLVVANPEATSARLVTPKRAPEPLTLDRGVVVREAPDAGPDPTAVLVGLDGGDYTVPVAATRLA